MVREAQLGREFGIWQKQSSFVFQAVAARTQILDNIVFNGPRAAFNFNDGFAGAFAVCVEKPQTEERDHEKGALCRCHCFFSLKMNGLTGNGGGGRKKTCAQEAM